MESHAKLRYLRSTARKARLVADAVKGRKVGDALSMLRYTIKKGVARDVAKVIKSAVANMQSRHAEANINVDTLRIKAIAVDQGPVLKRFRPGAQGRANRILKHMCHISVTVSD